MINVFNVLSFHIVFLFSEIGLKFFELRETFILPLGHGIESLCVLLSDVLGLIFYAGGKVWNVFVLFLISIFYFQLLLDSFKLFFQFIQGLFQRINFIFQLALFDLN